MVVTQVFDCWFESGSMPYAYIHYPFENRELFEKNFPGNFVAEGLDQTRGWFVTLFQSGGFIFFLQFVQSMACGDISWYAMHVVSYAILFFRERAGELRIIKLREETVQNGPKYNGTKGQTQDHQNLTKHKTTNTCYTQECSCLLHMETAAQEPAGRTPTQLLFTKPPIEPLIWKLQHQDPKPQDV
jgi:hypothetical protein